MSEGRPGLRIAPGAEGVSIWSPDVFGAGDAPKLREFLARAFAVREVEAVEIRRDAGFGRISYAAAPDPAGLWRRIAASLRGEEAEAAPSRPRWPASAVDGLYLDPPGHWPIRVGRVGKTVSTWRIRPERDGLLRLAHPVLRERKAYGFRLEEKLAEIFGVESFEARRFSADILVRLDPKVLTPERLARELEKAWPALIDGSDDPPSNKRLIAAGALLGLAAAGQFAVPALRPVAVGAVVVYSAPNVATAVRQLRRGVVGVPALYTLGLAMMLASGLPLTGTIMASLMQLWPYLSHRTIVNRQRRLFAVHRRRPVWARIGDGEVEVHVDDLKPGDEVVARAGEIAPVDGVVTAGVAAVADPVRSPGEPVDVSPGDRVFAGARLVVGELRIRVERAGEAAAAARLSETLPQSVFRDLPSLHEAERVANRNARPALALALANLLTVRSPRFSQAVIRPDYVTAPRLSAQLTALYDVAEALRHGLSLRRPGALDLWPDIDVVAIDDGAGLERRRVEIVRVAAIAASEDEVLAYAASALGGRGERGEAVALRLGFRGGRPARVGSRIVRRAGARLFMTRDGRKIAVVSEAFLTHSGVDLGAGLRALANVDGDPAARALFVLRDDAPIGVVTFARRGEPEAIDALAALKARNPKMQFVHLSSGPKGLTQRTADASGADAAFGALDAREKAALLRGLGRRVIWVGDGSAPEAATVMGASAVSVSTAGFSADAHDRADVLALNGGLAGLDTLAALAAARKRWLAEDYRSVYAANLVGVAGAFLANFSSLQSGLLSNLGSGVVYARQIRRLNGLIAAIEADQKRAVG